MGDNTETSKINTLVENLLPYAGQIECIGATARFQAMDQANRDFARVQDTRYTAESAKASGNMKSAIIQWKPVYKSVVKHVNAHHQTTQGKRRSRKNGRCKIVIDRDIVR